MLFYLWDSGWLVPIYILITGHWTSISSSLYLHRAITHKGVTFKAPINFLMRTWLWLATGMSTKEWVACHRKHHAHPDEPEDPHSPVQKGFWSIIFGGVFHYRKAVADKEMVEKFGKGCPDDWLENKVYMKYRSWGIYILMGINILLFGFIYGPIAWLGQVLWMIVIGHTVNGLGHGFGIFSIKNLFNYRNTDVKDHSTNIIPVGILIAGEELHNNHHANPASPKFSRKWYEFDMGWVYIKTLSLIGLAKVRYSTTK